MIARTRLNWILPTLGRQNDETSEQLYFAELAVIDDALTFHAIGRANVIYRRLQQVRDEVRGNSFCTHRTEMRRHPFRMRPEKLLHQLFAKALVLMLA